MKNCPKTGWSKELKLALEHPELNPHPMYKQVQVDLIRRQTVQLQAFFIRTCP